MENRVKAYCVRCRAKRALKNPRKTSAAGREVVKGTCPVCGAQITHFLDKRDRGTRNTDRSG